MLSNAYFLAKFRFDTAENEPVKNLQNFANFPNLANPNPSARAQSAAGGVERGAPSLRGRRRRPRRRRRRGRGRPPSPRPLAAPRSGKLDRARSRLYRSQILQVNTRWNSYLFEKKIEKKGHGERLKNEKLDK